MDHQGCQARKQADVAYRNQAVFGALFVPERVPFCHLTKTIPLLAWLSFFTDPEVNAKPGGQPAH
jgi:hypothetical protein